MKKFVMSFCAVFVLAACLLVTGCKAPSSSGAGETVQGGVQQLPGGQQSGVITKNNVADYIKNMTQSGTVKVTGEIDSNTIAAVKSALLYLKVNKPEVKVGLDLGETAGLTEIPQDAFYNYKNSCINLESIVIPDSVTGIGSDAFNGCTALEKVNIPAGVEIIGAEAFNNCTGIKEVTIPEGVEYIDIDAFGGLISLKEVVIPDSLIGLYPEAFDSCTSLEKVTLKGSFDFGGAGGNPFSHCTSLKTFTLEGDSKFKVEDGVLYEDCPDRKYLMCYPAGKTDESFTIPSGVIIWDEAFSGAKYLKSVTIPIDATLAVCIFADCTALEEIIFNGTKEEILGLCWDYPGQSMGNPKTDFVKCSDGNVPIR